MTQSSKLKENGIAATLSKCTLFASFSIAQLLEVASISRIVSFQKDRLITRADEELPGVYIVQSGVVRIFTSVKIAKRRLHHSLGSGMCFGVSALVPGERSLTNSIAQSKTVKAVFIPQKPLLALYQTIPQLAMNAAVTLYAFIRVMAMHAQLAQGRSIETRLAGWMLEQAVWPGVEKNGGFTGAAKAGAGLVTMAMSKAVLAQDLNVSPQSLSRALRHFRKRGLITSKGKSVHLLNRPEIEAWAAGGRKMKTVKRREVG